MPVGAGHPVTNDLNTVICPDEAASVNTADCVRGIADSYAISRSVLRAGGSDIEYLSIVQVDRKPRIGNMRTRFTGNTVRFVESTDGDAKLCDYLGFGGSNGEAFYAELISAVVVHSRCET